jgi:hypothetical protein
MTTSGMWISGRRAFRPDRAFYRDRRRVGLRSSRGRRMPGVGWLAGIVVVAVALWFFFKH